MPEFEITDLENSAVHGLDLLTKSLYLYCIKRNYDAASELATVSMAELIEMGTDRIYPNNDLDQAPTLVPPSPQQVIESIEALKRIGALIDLDPGNTDIFTFKLPFASGELH